MRPVREPCVAGRFYPADRARLASTVASMLGAARGTRPEPGRVVALVSPHAGYVYSGPIAAEAYHLLRRGEFRRVVVVGPSHRVPLRGSSILDRGAYRTPLGDVPVDEEMARALLDAAPREVRVEPSLHRMEHSLEVQLPFLQEALGDFLLTPVVMGIQDEPHRTLLADAIATAVLAIGAASETLLVASTDLSHYYPEERAREIDGVLLDDLSRFDDGGLGSHLSEGLCEACGGGPLVTTLRAARRLGASAVEVLAYGTSADAGGGRDEVVGYVAAAVTRAG